MTQLRGLRGCWCSPPSPKMPRQCLLLSMKEREDEPYGCSAYRRLCHVQRLSLPRGDVGVRDRAPYVWRRTLSSPYRRACWVRRRFGGDRTQTCDVAPLKAEQRRSGQGRARKDAPSVLDCRRSSIVAMSVLNRSVQGMQSFLHKYGKGTGRKTERAIFPVRTGVSVHICFRGEYSQERNSLEQQPMLLLSKHAARGGKWVHRRIGALHGSCRQRRERRTARLLAKSSDASSCEC